MAILAIDGYQYFLSGVFGSGCRFLPTCSVYSRLSFQEFGFLKGFYLTSKRLLKCHPWGSHGFDPVISQNPMKENKNHGA